MSIMWKDRSNKEIIHNALKMWSNYIQTEDPTHSAQDCEDMNEKHRIKALSLEQMEFVIKLNKLANKILYYNEK